MILCDGSGIKGLEKLQFQPKYLLVLGLRSWRGPVTCLPLVCLVIGQKGDGESLCGGDEAVMTM